MQYLSKDVSLYLSQNAVHHPVDAGGTDAVGGADAALLQVFHDVLYEGQLDVLGVLYDELLPTSFVAQDDGFVGEDGEVQLASVADEFDAVGAGTLVADEAPRAAAGQAVGKLEGGADGVFRLIKSASVAAEAFCPDNGAKDFLKQVNLVGCEVVEVSSTCDVALHAPGEGCAVVVEVARRAGKAYLHRCHLADGTFLYEFLHFLEVRQIASVVGHEAWHMRLFADAVDALTVEIAACQRLLYVDRLSCLHGHDGIGGM